jgi:hypothetical protein
LAVARRSFVGRINKTRAVLGGLVAGLILNLGELVSKKTFLAGRSGRDMGGLHLSPFSDSILPWLDMGGFIAGILGVLVYATLRMRVGLGSRTALLAGVIIWVPAGFVALLVPLTAGALQWHDAWPEMLWAFFEIPLATVVGAWLYEERRAD